MPRRSSILILLALLIVGMSACAHASISTPSLHPSRPSSDPVLPLAVSPNLPPDLHVADRGEVDLYVAVMPLGMTDDGLYLDLVMVVEAETHTREWYIVQSPLGLTVWDWMITGQWNPDPAVKAAAEASIRGESRPMQVLAGGSEFVTEVGSAIGDMVVIANVAQFRLLTGQGRMAAEDYAPIALSSAYKGIAEKKSAGEYGAGEQAKTAGMMFLQMNPLSGPAFAGAEIGTGIYEDDYTRVGKGGAHMLALLAAARSVEGKMTFSEQVKMPTFKAMVSRAKVPEKFSRVVRLRKGKVKPAEFKLRSGEEGLSLFEQKAQPSVPEVVEAVRLAGKQGELQASTLAAKDIQGLGLRLVKTRGGTPVPRVNAIHYEARVPISLRVRLIFRRVSVSEHFNQTYSQKLFELSE